MSGSILAHYRPDGNAASTKCRLTPGDPNTEADWKPAGFFSGGKATLSDSTPGTTVWIRVRTVGLKGVMGAWSDPAKIMVV